jgi:hypothetical protein
MNPNREDVQAIRAREIAQAVRTRESLQQIRPHFGWTFGILAFAFLGISASHFYSKLLLAGELSRLSDPEARRTLTSCCLLFGAGLVYAMAWWSTRKANPPQRAWGIAASLLTLALPLYLVYVAHKPMKIAEWELTAYGALALFIYGWPDRWVLDTLSAKDRPSETLRP